MSGRGIGVVCALFAAIDAGAEDVGGRRRVAPASRRPGCINGGRRCNGRRCSRLPPWRCWRFRCWSCATALVAYPLSFLVQMVSVDAGFRLATAYADMVRYAFAPAALPTVIPRLVTLCLAARFSCSRSRRSRQRPDICAWKRRTAIAADGGHASSARPGAPSQGCAIFARRSGISFADPRPRRSRRRPI